MSAQDAFDSINITNREFIGANPDNVSVFLMEIEVIDMLFSREADPCKP